MLPDSILRCLVPVKIKGSEFTQVFESVRNGTNVLIVLQWGVAEDGSGGLTPKDFVPIPETEVKAVATAESEYELISQMGIDFDSAAFIDLADAIPISVRALPEN